MTVAADGSGRQLILMHAGAREGSSAGRCGHEWVIGPEPMGADLVLRVVGGAVCPACGGIRGIRLGSREPPALGSF